MAILIFSRGINALFSIEYMKMIVEKMSKTVMKQLLAMLIIEVVEEMPLPLKVRE